MREGHAAFPLPSEPRSLRREPFGARSARSLGTLERMRPAGTERPLPTNREWLKFRVLSEMLCLSPVRVKSAALTTLPSLPVYPKQQTLGPAVGNKRRRTEATRGYARNNEAVA